MYGVHQYVDHSGLPLRLLELLRLRVSQLNGCAFAWPCTPLARRHGVTEAELTLLPAWREAPTLSAAERATLAWAEALTQLTHWAWTTRCMPRCRCILTANRLPTSALPWRKSTPGIG